MVFPCSSQSVNKKVHKQKTPRMWGLAIRTWIKSNGYKKQNNTTRYPHAYIGEVVPPGGYVPQFYVPFMVKFDFL